ncbi:hypothetical protein SRABI76_03313 [Microbacterium oxydans]|uniref:DUF2975 domain-containing protein n=1 Tax=Microbacterium oxydans TaxID=82380 RepID=UPI001D30FFF5|nr:DUF2975 domain-containing protein [Microbacterium oxydans]CAH0253937.1 hypothetical protein SRABI76_03313 [Microbacterium oxydans]
MSTSKTGSLSRGDAAALIGFCIAGLAIATFVVVFSILRIIELARGVDVPVLVVFTDTPVQIPLADGDSVTGALDRAMLTASSLPPIATGAGIIGQVVQAVTIVAVIGCLILLARSILSGRVFSRRNTVLVMTAGLTGLVGFAAVQFFDNMLANATVAVVTDNRIDNAVISVEPFTFILAAFILSVIGTVFVIGERLQRETEGLV